MSDLDRIRRRIQEEHPRVAPELIRREIGESAGRTARLQADVEVLREECWIDAHRRGEHPRPGAEPFLNPKHARMAQLFHCFARATLAVEMIIAGWVGWRMTPGAAKPLLAIAASAFAYGVAYLTRGALAKLFDRRRPQETEARLGWVAFLGFVGALLALSPLLLTLRGSTTEILDAAIPAGLLLATLALSVTSASCFWLGEWYGQPLVRAYLTAVDALARERLFKEELQRMLDHHPFGRSRGNDRPPRRAIPSALLLLALLVPRPTLAFRSAHVLFDSTGSGDRASLQATAAVLGASLPDLVIAFELEVVEVSGWGARTTWLPPAAVFPMPQQEAEECRAVSRSTVGILFPHIADVRSRKAEDARRAARAKADSVRRALVVQACAVPAALLRELAEAGRIPEPECSPHDELFARCGLEPSSRLSIVVTDGISCRPAITVPKSSASRTIVIIIPSRVQTPHRSVPATLACKRSPGSVFF